jgi:predicted short-subunit dehydrogenase-like oxidoreductase (DUF2520 family)
MKKQMKIAIIGTGNVGSHLAKGFMQNGMNISTIWSRQKENSERLAKQINCDTINTLEELSPETTDLVIICVTDEAVAKVLEELPSSIPAAYTSGSIRLNELPSRNKLGVFYPLQTFSKERDIDLSSIPFLIESKDASFAEELHFIANKISSKVIYADSQDRYQLHIAAVMVNNFTNHIYYLANEHMQNKNLDFDLLKPLIHETVDKLNYLSPEKAQTGPAKRGDRKVIETHLSSLEGRTKEIYKLLSESIIDKYK